MKREAVAQLKAQLGLSERRARQITPLRVHGRCQNVILIGGPGTGRTHAETALGVQAI
ncbi:MAG: ATP-binding protein [Paracoccus hibiscisoli]|uniref:ATP-binding protein n=1 Tax=Paracoccus hibiscisoli TaxID=2023261 RepID=UPI003919750D